MKKNLPAYFIIICFLCFFISVFQYHMLEDARYRDRVTDKGGRIVETDTFRALYADKKWLDAINGFAEENNLEKEEVLTYYMLKNNFMLLDKKVKLYDASEYIEEAEKLKNKRKSEWDSVLLAYKAVFSDVEYFPIPASSTDYPINISFSDGWGNERYYNDVMHLHEGTDIMAEHGRGYVPVVSMTAGIVENIGWLRLGGYRIGIRSENGGYFYYAHLYKYYKDFKVGDKIEAGELLGFMGDSGYGETEGTVGKFAVHLHVGIYIKTKNYEELAVNPFLVLSYVRERRVVYRFSGE